MSDDQARSTSETPLARLRWRAMAEQNDLAFAWFLACITGGIAISFAPDDWRILRMSLPLFAMAAFVVFGLTRSRFSTPRLADSVYFLGFLWTLWALIDVLVFSQELNATELYKAFGYALIATASGMFVRLALLQFYRTIDDQEEQAVDEMDQAVERLRSSADSLVAELQRTQGTVGMLRSDAATRLQEWHKEFADAAQKPVDAVHDAADGLNRESQLLADALKDVRAAITPVTRTIKELEARVARGSQTLGDEMTSSATAFEESLRTFRTNLSNVAQTPLEIEGQIRQVAEALQRALTPLDSMASKILNDVEKAIHDLAKTLLELPDDAQLKEVRGKLAGDLAALGSSSSALTETITLTGDSLERSGQQVRAFAGDIDHARSELSRGLSELIQQTAELRTVISAAQTSTRDVDSALRQVVGFVRKEVAEL